MRMNGYTDPTQYVTAQYMTGRSRRPLALVGTRRHTDVDEI